MKTLVSAMLLVLWCSTAIAITFHNPKGAPKVEKAGAEAAAVLNDGLAKIYRMLAAIELRDREAAEARKKIALKMIIEAAKKFAKVSVVLKETGRASSKLIIKIRNSEDKRLIDQFKFLLKRRGIPYPNTEGDLAAISTKSVRQFSTVMRETSVSALLKDKDSVRMKRFLQRNLNMQFLGLIVSRVWTISR